MTENNFTPPPELVQQWVDTYFGGKISQSNFHVDLATRAAKWGADQELDACCAWLSNEILCESNVHRFLRDARRPKPPSLKEQALEALDLLIPFIESENKQTEAESIRRALEQLPE